jgi:hypothetical protein
VPNPGAVEKFETLVTYQSDSGADVKLFLMNAENRERVCNVSEKTLVDAALKSSYYQPVTVHLHYKLNATDFYTLIASTFKTDKLASGTITFESDQPLVLKEIPSEGHGLKKISI